MTARLKAAAVVIAACVGPEGAAQPPTRPPNLPRRADPPKAPLTGVLRAPEWRHGSARPGTLPGLPDYAYTAAHPVRPAVAVLSLVRVPAARIAGAAPLPEGTHPAQMYQLPVQRMQADHCFLSRVALHDDGSYQPSFRAVQNPRPGGDSPALPTEFTEGPRLTHARDVPPREHPLRLRPAVDHADVGAGRQPAGGLRAGDGDRRADAGRGGGGGRRGGGVGEADRHPAGAAPNPEEAAVRARQAAGATGANPDSLFVPRRP